MKLSHLLTIILLIIILRANAEVTLDGTLGRVGALPGPDYLIGADLGRQHGGNLFHSFKDFNLNSSESATFSGPNSVNNIISRVTGGNLSNIDGLIRSAIPADMYFLNPYGFMFGPNARLDVQGSFHISTADYLRLGDGGRFEARNHRSSLLTIAPIEAFGFFTDTPASITTQDSQLSVSVGKTLSLIGGDLSLNGTSPPVFDEQGFAPTSEHSKLSAMAGQINLASIAASGEVILTNSGFKLNNKGGKITLDNTLVASNDGGVSINGGQLIMQNSTLHVDTLADQSSKGINLQATDSINISGNIVTILALNSGTGNGGDITITTPYLKVVGSYIEVSSFGAGNAGNIKVNTKRTEFKDGGGIGSGAFGTGKGSNISIEAKESVSVSGQRDGNLVSAGSFFINYPAMIAISAHIGQGGNLIIETDQLNLNGGILATDTVATGNAGHTIIHANNINVKEGGIIATTAIAQGQAGDINITTDQTLLVSGRRLGFYITASGIKFENNQSGIFSFSLGTYPEETQPSGNIVISADKLILEQESVITASMLGDNPTASHIMINVKDLVINHGGQINNSNGLFLGEDFFVGNGQGGAIRVAADNVTISNSHTSDTQSGIFSDTFSSGQGGNVEVQTNNLEIANNGAISARSNGTGNAGQIIVQAHTVKLANQGNISTKAENAAGGNISVITPNLLYLQNGQITTSVGTGKGKGGNITIENPHFVVLNQGKVQANADEGQGGDIYIKSGQFIASPNSSVSASSRLGIDGEIKIDSPDVDISGAWLILPAKFVDASGKLKPPCSALAPNKNSFVVKRFTGGPSKPSDLQANMLILVQPEDEKMPLQKTSGGKKDARQSVLKVVSSCRPDSSQATSSVIPEQLF